MIRITLTATLEFEGDDWLECFELAISKPVADPGCGPDLYLAFPDDPVNVDDVDNLGAFSTLPDDVSESLSLKLYKYIERVIEELWGNVLI